jgi:hypothetical protein
MVSAKKWHLTQNKNSVNIENVYVILISITRIFNEIHTKIILSPLSEFVTFEHLSNTFISIILIQKNGCSNEFQYMKLNNLHSSPNNIWINKSRMRLVGHMQRTVKGTVVPLLN